MWHVCVQVCEWGACMSVRMSVCMCDMCVVCICAVCLCVNLCLLTGRAGVKSSGLHDTLYPVGVQKISFAKLN